MSTGLECELIEVTPGRWMLVLEDDNAPKNSWDWREYSTSYGMFTSEDETWNFLSAHFANPGGGGVSEYYPGWKPDEIEQKLIVEAPRNRDQLLRGRY